MPVKITVALATTLLAAAVLQAHAGPAARAATDFVHQGEHGLAVDIVQRRLEVRWITREHTRGRLLVLDETGHTLQDVSTRAGRLHTVRVPLPSGPVRLQYGSRGDATDRHETRIDPAPPTLSPFALPAVDSLFVVGDTHGELERLRQLLRNAGVTDGADRWSAGRAHLVFLGDLMDRGADVNALLWFVHRLEHEAQRAGGRVHVVLGNHELMVFTSDERYVHPKELALAQLHAKSYGRLFDIRSSILGRWLASKPGMLQVGDMLMVHGGVSSDWLPYTVGTFNDTLRAFMGEDLFHNWADPTFPVTVDSAALERRNDFFWSERSVFWYRGYVQSDTLRAELDSVLSRYGVRTMVVAHTPQPTMTARYGGDLLAVHPRLPALEMMLVVREEGSEPRRMRFGLEGGATTW